MEIITVMAVLIFLLLIYSIAISFFYFKERNKSVNYPIEDDLDYKLSDIRTRLKRIRKETPMYINLNINNNK